MRWCHDSLTHRGAGATPPGRGQAETDKCAAAGVSPVPGLCSRPSNLSPRLGAAPRLRPAVQPGAPVPCPDPGSQSCIPAPHPPSNLHRPTTGGHRLAQTQGRLRRPRPARLLLGASRPAARAEPGSSLSFRPRGVCDSPQYSRLRAPADTSTDKPNSGQSI